MQCSPSRRPSIDIYELVHKVGYQGYGEKISYTYGETVSTAGAIYKSGSLYLKRFLI